MKTLRTRIASVVFAFLASLPAASSASIYDVTGLWYNPNESGWGMNVIQQSNTLFITLTDLCEALGLEEDDCLGHLVSFIDDGLLRKTRAETGEHYFWLSPLLKQV